ncbi:DNA-binding GntR family transcriptional regulator [Pullulanibacillus pueri]|uniref:GntR family transcriptional regulator n=1 Tax=Pullulanibacillus pueri TaxID=1437324 RepID=A0A8J3EPT0_9BACL|nr:GntR family transcriptional regulator [Pullulanibacillus pueri]MBM7684223.1 DNA-binding GntR family transcriptional regulator [Pullulanibacillus pueri]GGH88999.1 GntR family transcriptional regulator [Pullulanibacillus pueri]
MEKLNKNKDASPLYAQIAEEIRNKIELGVWQPGDKIPAELELCEFYDVSRITIRKAIDELVHEKLLHRERAKGTFVLDLSTKTDKQENYTYVKSFTKEMAEIGEKAETLKAEIKLITANKELARKLMLNEGDQVLQLNRVRGINNKGFVYFKTFIPHDKYFSLNAKDYYGSFYELLKTKGIIVNQIKEYIEATKPTQEVMENLNVNEDEPILKRVRIGKQKNTQFREYTECHYIGSQYRYHINFI